MFIFLLAYYLTPFFQIVVSPPLPEPLGVDFELPRGPSHLQKTNKNNNKNKNNNTSPAHILDAWQRGGFREAYGDPPRCSRLQGAA